MSTPQQADRNTTRPGHTKRMAVILLCAPALIWAVMNLTPEAEPARLSARAMPVTTVRVQHSDTYRSRRDFTGEIVARRSTNLGFEIPGTVTELTVDEGDDVTADQLLASLDTRRLGAEKHRLLAQRAQAQAVLDERIEGPRPETIALARAQVAERQADLDLANRKRAKWDGLYTTGAASEEERDDAVSAQQAASARLDQAQEHLNELLAGTRKEHINAQRALLRQLDAQLEAIDVDLSKSRIVAPFAGRIARRLVDEGAVVPAGQVVLRIVEYGHLEARVGLTLDAVSALAVGQTVRVTSGDTQLEARVQAHLPEIDPATRTMTVVLQLASLETALHPGQIIRLPVEETVVQSGFWIPTTALLRAEQGLWSCYVIDDADTTSGPRVRRTSIEVLHTEAQRAYVRGLLADGDHVVASGVGRVVPGQRVEILESSGSPLP